MSPAPDRYSCSHGHCGPSHRRNRNHCSLVELDCGLPLAQTRGRVHRFPQNTIFTHSEVDVSVSLLSYLILRCRPRYMRSCAQCWRDDTQNTVTDIDFLSCALSYMRCSDSGRSPRWPSHTKPSETAGQPNDNMQ